MTDRTEGDLDSVLVEVLGLAPGAVLPDDALIEDLPNLDSLKFLKLVTTLEAVTGGDLSADTMMELETVGDLRRAFGAGGRSS